MADTGPRESPPLERSCRRYVQCLGRIDIFDTYSLVEIGGHISPAAFGRISNAKVSGQSLKIQLDTTSSTGGPSSGPRRSGPGNERPARSGYHAR